MYSILSASTKYPISFIMILHITLIHHYTLASLNLQTSPCQHLKIGLTLPRNGIDFGNYLLRDTSMLFYSNNVSDFRSYFKGLYFEMDPNSDPLLLSLSLVSNQTTYYNYFMLYGHTADGTTTEYSFALDSKNPNACYNRFDHNYSTATLGDKGILHTGIRYHISSRSTAFTPG